MPYATPIAYLERLGIDLPLKSLKDQQFLARASLAVPQRNQRAALLFGFLKEIFRLKDLSGKATHSAEI